MTMYNPSARLLWSSLLTGPGTTLVAGSFRSGDINLRDVTDVWLAVAVGTAPGGTAPTLDVSLEFKDSAAPVANYFPGMLSVPQITAAGLFQIAGGMHIATKPLLLPERARLALVVGGTANPTFSQTVVSLYGR